MPPEIVCISPIDGEELVRRPVISDVALGDAITKAIRAQRAWRRTPLDQRIVTVMKAVDEIDAMNAEVVPELARQMGRPVRFGGESKGVRERAAYMASIANEGLATLVFNGESGGIRRVIKREPVGIVLVIAPWNYPFLTATNGIVPGLISGNAVLLKHASQTILVGERFQDAFDRAGLPAGLFQNLVLSHDQTAKLLSSGEIDHCSFTGSPEAGRAIERAAAGTFMSLGLELGGKDPAYVRHDANLDHAIEGIIDAGYFNSGQCCCGIERAYIHKDIYDDFVEGARAAVSGYVLGNPLHQSTTMGPMAHKRFADLVRRQTKEAIAAGATPLIDTGRFEADDGTSAYLAPQLLADVSHEMSVMRDESFGPVLGVMKVNGDDEAIRLMNDSDFGLTAAVWTSDIQAAENIGDELETGTVFMNRADYLDPGLAWTGVKDSGRGISLSQLGYHSLTQPKSYHLRKLVKEAL